MEQVAASCIPPPEPQQSPWEGGGICWIAGIVSVFSSVQFSRSVVSDSLQPHGLQHARLLCPLPTPRAHSNACPLSRWYHPTISSSVVLFSSCLQSFPTSGSFPMSQFIASDGQSIGVLALASVLPVKLHSHLEARNWWQLWHFLPTDVTGDVSFHTISQYSALQAYGQPVGPFITAPPVLYLLYLVVPSLYTQWMPRCIAHSSAQWKHSLSTVFQDCTWERLLSAATYSQLTHTCWVSLPTIPSLGFSSPFWLFRIVPKSTDELSVLSSAESIRVLAAVLIHEIVVAH